MKEREDEGKGKLIDRLVLSRNVVSDTDFKARSWEI